MRAIFLGTILVGLGLAQPVTAQTPSPAAKLGMFPFPAKDQTKEQQATDEQACYAWAGQQTGIDPVAAANPNTEAAAAVAKQKADSATTGAAVAGAAGGAVAGVAIGAIAGDAGTGAAIGAAAGAMKGRRAKKQAEAKAAQQGAQAAKAQGNAQLDTFKKAMGSCLEGKGYTVK
jgi:hypothetical protein